MQVWKIISKGCEYFQNQWEAHALTHMHYEIKKEKTWWNHKINTKFERSTKQWTQPWYLNVFSLRINRNFTWQARSKLTGWAMLEALLPQKCSLILAFCSSTKIFSPTGFLIQCMTSRRRVLKVFRQRSSSFKSGQWQMSRRGRSKTACPGRNHGALVSLQGWTSTAVRGKNKLL